MEKLSILDQRHVAPFRADLPLVLKRLRDVIPKLDALAAPRYRRKSLLRKSFRQLLEWEDGPFEPRVIGAVDERYPLVAGLTTGFIQIDCAFREMETDITSVKKQLTRTHLENLVNIAAVGYSLLWGVHKALEEKKTAKEITSYLQPLLGAYWKKRGLSETAIHLSAMALHQKGFEIIAVTL